MYLKQPEIQYFTNEGVKKVDARLQVITCVEYRSAVFYFYYTPLRFFCAYCDDLRICGEGGSDTALFKVQHRINGFPVFGHGKVQVTALCAVIFGRLTDVGEQVAGFYDIAL